MAAVESIDPAEEWSCGRCGETVPGNFDICWACGTTRDGWRDPGFQPLDDVQPENPTGATGCHAPLAGGGTKPDSARRQAPEGEQKSSEVDREGEPRVLVGRLWELVLGLLQIAAAVGIFWSVIAIWATGHNLKLHKRYSDMPQEMTLDELFKQGPLDNLHVRLRGFSFCEQYALTQGDPFKARDGLYIEAWLPIVPACEPLRGSKEVKAIVVFETGRTMTKEQIEDLRRQDVLEGMVDPDVGDRMAGPNLEGLLAQQIRRLYPGTELSKCVFFDCGRKMDAAVDDQRLCLIAVSILVGSVLFLVLVKAYDSRKTRRVRRRVGANRLF